MRLLYATEPKRSESLTRSEVQLPGYRYYSPKMGRWLNRDPIGEEGGVGLFVFARNVPLSAADPVGLCTAPERLPIEEKKPYNFKWRDDDRGNPIWDKKTQGKTEYTLEVDCSCYNTGRESRTRPGIFLWKIKCRIEEKKPVAIHVNAFKDSFKHYGIIGHERIHIENFRRYAADLAAALTDCEKRYTGTPGRKKECPAACTTSATNLESRARGSFADFRTKEENHDNFKYPEAYVRYHQNPAKSTADPLISPYPTTNPATDYVAPTAFSICGP